MNPIDLAAWERDGYTVVRGFFGAAEIAALGEAAERVRDEARAHGRNFRHGNLYYTVIEDAAGAPQVPMAQWPSYAHPALEAVRRDPRFAALLEPLLGRDIKQIINQLHWKNPGTRGDFAWHQDSRFRRPERHYRNLATSYVQTGLAIDPHTRASGAMRFIPGSHRAGPLALDTNSQVLGGAMENAALIAAGLRAEDAVDLELAPGDLALWNPYLVHGSGTNTADHRRRLYINGYVRAEDCDRGEWAFRGGQPAPLTGEPALVHFEALHERPGPHYP